MRNVREVAMDNLAGLMALYAELNPADPQLTPHEAMKLLAAMLAHPGCKVLGSFEDELLAACCTIFVLPNMTRGGSPYALIENVVTGAAHRRKGHARAVLGAATDHAFAAGCYKVMLMTGRSDPSVHTFYESCGFSPSKTGFQRRPTNWQSS